MKEGGSAPGTVRLTVYGATDPGREREENQDTFLAVDLSVPGRDGGFRQASLDGFPSGGEPGRFDLGAQGSLLLVADGMGGAAAGQVASRMAATCVYEVLSDGWTPGREASPEAFRDRLVEAAEQANARVHAWSRQHEQYRGMGSTLTLAGLLGGGVHLAHVGDSRAYLVRDGEVRQITEDQTVAQKLVESGSLSPEEALESRQSHVLLRALGTEPEVEAQPEAIELRAGDGLLLCTDGLSHLVPPTRIAEILRAAPDPATAVDRLIEGANDGGGHDNITVVFARVGAGDATAGGS